jgi:hypothetical protein
MPEAGTYWNIPSLRSPGTDWTVYEAVGTTTTVLNGREYISINLRNTETDQQFFMQVPRWRVMTIRGAITPYEPDAVE